ncbi:hypothetical protein ACOMHN_034015 [Nucella lapillus]
MDDSMDVDESEQPVCSDFTTDWDLCALCQDKTKEKLQCPARAKQKSGASTYVTLACNLKQFQELGAVPKKLVDRLSEGKEMEETFKFREANFHASFLVKYNTTKLTRKHAEAFSESDVEGQGMRKSLRVDTEKTARKICFLCDEEGNSKDLTLRNASTFQLDGKVRKCAILLQDKKLLAKLSAGDIMAQELKYRTSCLIRWYRRAQPKAENNEQEKGQMLNGLVFAELIEHIEEQRDQAPEDVLTVFKLADLAIMYQQRLKDYGLQPGRIHSSRLKMRLLAHFPDLQAYADSRDIRLAFACDLNATLKEAYNRESWDEGVHLAKAAKIVRRDMFLLKSKFTGSFSESSQLSSVPETLLALMEIILDGPSLGNSGRGRQQASLTLAQLASFNAVKRARTNTATIKHSNERETPLPVYVGLAIHAQTRKKALVDNMFTLGLSVSYNRVLEISTELASKACSQFHSDGVVCPMKLRSGLFTTAAIDNLDHNPSSTTAKDAFHGTAISLFQHPTDTIAGEERTCVNADYQPSKKLSVPDLPEFALKLPVEPPDQNVHAADDTDHYVKAMRLKFGGCRLWKQWSVEKGQHQSMLLGVHFMQVKSKQKGTGHRG